MVVQQTVRRRMGVPSGTGQTILVLQSGLAAAAILRKDKRFRRLFPLLWRREWLDKAIDEVLDNSGSETPGVDGKRGSWLRDSNARALFVRDLQRSLRKCKGRLRVSPVLRAYVPKASGDQRPIGIPTIRDRVVQMALKMALEPIFEADFLPNSCGFRPGRSTLDAVLPVYRYGDSQIRYGWVVEGDIKDCFDNLDHKILMDRIRRRIADRRILRLIWCFLKAPVVERGKRAIAGTGEGTPQGGVLSPLLANIYLNMFDQYWYAVWGKQTRQKLWLARKKGKASCVLFRYADDFILVAKGDRSGVECIARRIKKYFRRQMNLELSTEKTRVVPLERGVRFLGFHIRRERLGHFSCVRIRPTHGNVARLRVKLQYMLGRQAEADDPAIKITELNRVLNGWANYYAPVNAYRSFSWADYTTRRLIDIWNKHKGKQYKGMLKQEGSRRIFRRGKTRVELFRMLSLPSQHTSLDLKTCWRYRHKPNPYLTGKYMACTKEDQPLINVRNVHPIDPRYNVEIYLQNRLKRFEVDNWRCVNCGALDDLMTHHVEPVPRSGVFDPAWVHRVENLRTMCTNCHKTLPRH